MAYHKQKFVWISGKRILIDEDIAPLIGGLSSLDIQTVSSCQADCGGVCRRKHRIISIKDEIHRNKPGKMFEHHMPKLCRESVWIVFWTAEDAAKFMNIVYNRSDPPKLRDQMQGSGAKNSHAWNWYCRAMNINDLRYRDHRGYWVGKAPKKDKFDFFVHLTFPRAHLSLVTERILKKKNEQEKAVRSGRIRRI